MSARFLGLGVSPGVALGRVHLLRERELPVVPDPIPPERVAEEIERFHAARRTAQDELGEIKRRVLAALGERCAGILEAQALILDDAHLIELTEQRIRVGRVSARWAVKEVAGEFARRFAAMDETHLREKGGDLHDVHLRLQRLLRTAPERPAEGVPAGRLVVVAESLSPSDAIELSRRGVAGLASDVGGRTSHTAILAQALGVPAVAGLRELSRHARDGEPILLDGRSGEVVLRPTAAELERAQVCRQAWLDREQRLLAAEPLAGGARTSDGVEIALRANVALPGEIDAALRLGAQGIGLYRSEFLFLTHRPAMPSEDQHYAAYREIARAVAPHPAVLRTLDLGGDPAAAQDERRALNPVLGLRAIRFCLARPDVFRPQLRGLLRAAVEPNVRILLPLVTEVDELRAVRALLAEEARALGAAGQPHRADVPLGAMIEVPVAALAADALAAESDFLSLGTNDLIQYALAVDRGNEAVSYLYRPGHLGVLRLLSSVAEAARAACIPVTVCGEMAADPEMLPLLIGLGFRELSLPPRAIAPVREALARLSAAEAWAEADARVRRAYLSSENRPSGRATHA